MPRQARLDAPGALHHIMVRGINKTDIFADTRTKPAFWNAWVPLCRKAMLSLRLGSHGQPRPPPLQKRQTTASPAVMRKLLTWYAQYYNRRHNRTGHLFQNRYKSILCDEDNYLLALVRYIHLNPVRAQIVKTIEELGPLSLERP